MMIPIPKGGIYEGVAGVERASAVPDIEEVIITAKEGQKLLPLPEGASYLGFIFARGESPERVERALREAHACLRVRDCDCAAGRPALILWQRDAGRAQRTSRERNDGLHQLHALLLGHDCLVHLRNQNLELLHVGACHGSQIGERIEGLRPQSAFRSAEPAFGD